MDANVRRIMLEKVAIAALIEPKEVYRAAASVLGEQFVREYLVLAHKSEMDTIAALSLALLTGAQFAEYKHDVHGERARRPSHRLAFMHRHAISG